MPVRFGDPTAPGSRDAAAIIPPERLVRARFDDASFQEYHALACCVKSCSKAKDLAEAVAIHGRIKASSYAADRYLKNLLMDMYSKCGSLEHVRSVFQSLDRGDRNAFSWNIMVSALGRNGHLEEARKMYEDMPEKSTVGANAMINAYAKGGHLAEALDVFARIPKKDVVSWTSIVTAYAENGHILEARRIFDKMPDKNVVSWTAMITGYIENGSLGEARRLFDAMPVRNISSWNNMVKGYAMYGHTEEARAVFDDMPQKNVISWTCMVTAYAQKGNLREARGIFDAMPDKNVVSWNAMITAYAQYGYLGKAKRIFDAMPKRDPVTWTAMVTAFAQHGDILQARALFEKMPQKVLVSYNAMVAAYAQNGDVDESRRLFDAMEQRNVASWNAMISGYVKNGRGWDALEIFKLMDLAGMHPNDITFMSAIDACADLQALLEGQILHAEITASGTEPDAYLRNALLHMYGRCGSLAMAESLFDDMPDRDRWSWNVMISSYAHAGHTRRSLAFFAEMALDGITPDGVTFVAVLGACSHAGRVDLGCHYFVSMSTDYSMARDVDHDLYVCLIDVLGRSGWIKEAEDLIANMPFQPDSVAWATLLGGYRNYGSLGRGAQQAAQCVFQLDPEDSAPYVLLHNLYKSGRRRQEGDGDFEQAMKPTMGYF
ncbi:pentatricopeptide repeat-containing protein At4g02750 [Selaginella moellendorffii]|nr:pentatricopeptide repeat-containing protein At4g02750 [Selaginella moellendorffii]|eukprot:XP_024520034.1 pentatricopeptide repeat-containing protein At4g02750 [Selaginella moellendorffii]